MAFFSVLVKISILVFIDGLEIEELEKFMFFLETWKFRFFPDDLIFLFSIKINRKYVAILLRLTFMKSFFISNKSQNLIV